MSKLIRITIPDGWIEIETTNIRQRLESGEELLGALDDLFGTYAAQIFSKEDDNIKENNKEFNEYLLKGRWYEKRK